MSDELQQGWGNPQSFNARGKFHYFAKDGRSLCGKWGRFMTPIDGDDKDEHLDNCAACQRKIAAYRQAQERAM